MLPNVVSYLSKQTYHNIQSSQQVEIMRNPDDDVLLKTQSFNEYAKYNRMPQLLVLEMAFLHCCSSDWAGL